jgi:hypothetical protein
MFAVPEILYQLSQLHYLKCKYENCKNDSFFKLETACTFYRSILISEFSIVQKEHLDKLGFNARYELCFNSRYHCIIPLIKFGQFQESVPMVQYNTHVHAITASHSRVLETGDFFVIDIYQKLKALDLKFEKVQMYSLLLEMHHYLSKDLATIGCDNKFVLQVLKQLPSFRLKITTCLLILILLKFHVEFWDEFYCCSEVDKIIILSEMNEQVDFSKDLSEFLNLIKLNKMVNSRLKYNSTTWDHIKG